LLQQGNTTAAQQLVTKALNLYPDSVIANRNADTSIKPTIAELLALQAADRLQHGNTAAASSDINRALILDPSNQDVKQLKAHGLSAPSSNPTGG
jgi:Tfp pilus assembly protein PilF